MVEGDASDSPRSRCISSSDDAAVRAKLAGCSDSDFVSNVDFTLAPFGSDACDKSKCKGKKRKRRPKKKGTSDADESIVTELVDDDGMKAEAANADDTTHAQTPAEPDNLVLRKLLVNHLFFHTHNLVEIWAVPGNSSVLLLDSYRGPRYFDPPDTSWGSCFNCGQQGHMTINCTVEKKKRPCYYCGSTEHSFKKCTKGRDCFICKTGGHQAKDCPKRCTSLKNGSLSDKICLRCGDSGHDMFSCKNNYFYEDLKTIQCYVCNDFGHLCCHNSSDHVLKEVSCCKCGSQGHTGLACARLLGETAGTISPTLCYNCGQGGHFARECPHPLKECSKFRLEMVDCAFSTCHSCGKEGHFSRDCSRSLKARSRLNGDFHGGKLGRSCRNCGAEGHFARECPNPVMGANSNHPDMASIYGETRFDEDGLATYSVPKRRGGWITEDPTDSPTPHRKAKSSRKRGRWITEDPPESTPPQRKANKKNSRWPPATPTSWKHQIHPCNSGGQSSGSRSYRLNYSYLSREVDSQGSTQPYHQRFPASRFYNYSSNNSSSSGGRVNVWW